MALPMTAAPTPRVGYIRIRLTNPAALPRCSTNGWRVAPSLLQSRAQLPGSAGGLATPPLGALGTPRCCGQRGELPYHALLPGLGRHVAAPFTSELAGSVWMRVRV